MQPPLLPACPLPISSGLLRIQETRYLSPSPKSGAHRWCLTLISSALQEFTICLGSEGNSSALKALTCVGHRWFCSVAHQGTHGSIGCNLSEPARPVKGVAYTTARAHSSSAKLCGSSFPPTPSHVTGKDPRLREVKRHAAAHTAWAAKCHTWSEMLRTTPSG